MIDIPINPESRPENGYFIETLFNAAKKQYQINVYWRDKSSYYHNWQRIKIFRGRSLRHQIKLAKKFIAKREKDNWVRHTPGEINGR